MTTLPSKPRILWLGGAGMVRPPACPVVADRHGMVAAPAVGHSQTHKLRHCQIPTSQTINHDFPVFVDCPDGSHRAADQGGMVLARHAISPGTRGLVDEVKAQGVSGHIFVAPSKAFPQ